MYEDKPISAIRTISRYIMSDGLKGAGTRVEVAGHARVKDVGNQVLGLLASTVGGHVVLTISVQLIGDRPEIGIATLVDEHLVLGRLGGLLLQGSQSRSGGTHVVIARSGIGLHVGGRQLLGQTHSSAGSKRLQRKAATDHTVAGIHALSGLLAAAPNQDHDQENHASGPGQLRSRAAQNACGSLIKRRIGHVFGRLEFVIPECGKNKLNY